MLARRAETRKTQAAGGHRACLLASRERRAFLEKHCEEGLDERRESVEKEKGLSVSGNQQG